jgi:hypothetical protein
MPFKAKINGYSYVWFDIDFIVIIIVLMEHKSWKIIW